MSSAKTNKTTGMRGVTAEGFEQQSKKDQRAGWAGDTFLNFELIDKLKIGKFLAPEGTNRIAFVPPRTRGWWFKRIWVHYNQGLDKSSFLCPRYHAEELMDSKDFKAARKSGKDPKACCICNTWEFYHKQDDDDAAHQYSYRKRGLCYVIDVSSDEKIAEGVKLYDAPVGKKDGTMGVVNALAKINKADREDENFRDVSITNPQWEFVFTREGTGAGQGTGYSECRIVKRKNVIPQAIIDAALELPEIEDLLVYHTSEEIERKLKHSSGTIVADDEVGEIEDVREEESEVDKLESDLDRQLDKLEEDE